MSKLVRIGGQGFYGDSSVAPRQLLEAGVDYLIMDYLAEATMSALGQMRRATPEAGYATDVVDWIWKGIKLFKETGAKFVTNAGGLNPRVCAQKRRTWPGKPGSISRSRLLKVMI